MSILQHNGAAIVCMAGKNCVAIASDTRFGLSQQTVSCDFQKVFKQSDRLFVGLAGLATDVQTLRNTLKFKREPASSATGSTKRRAPFRGPRARALPPPTPPRPAGSRSTSCGRSA